ncbi:hypothetical protein C7M61_000084 [Candidozyma pseudohaemuli]|uniref:K Homology domain-containing protein n=1 Tax=Candidozyma pseudohaemuli TaxID=418784 RepID=A0A2P7YWV8_9ASCO|nr:hypothetical protein C7M61_000084 [[Candida] pseudohaemulonii]PSK40445.1 hypothetical protein C7M61_000084 [[Candida] pseudohaemulonii]
MIVPSEISLSPTYDHLTVAGEELKGLSVDEVQKATSRICISSRAVVKISKTKDETNFLLHGSQEGVKNAKTLIKQKFRSKFQITFDIPSRSRRAVVGMKGSTVRAIKRKHNVDIKIDRRRLCKPIDFEDYHDVDQLALFKQNPSGEVRYVASVEVKVMGSQMDCVAAKTQILKLVLSQIVEFCHFPHGLYRYEARIRAKECFNDVSIFTGHSPINTLAVEGYKDTVYEVMKLLRSFADLECDSVVIPSALRYTGFMSSVKNVETEDSKENVHKDETNIIIKGHRADVSTARQMIVEHIAKYFSHRLMLIDLHGGNIEHVRRVLSLNPVQACFENVCDKNSVKVTHPEKEMNNVEYIEVFGLKEKDVMLSISQLECVVESVKPNDVHLCFDENLIWRLQPLLKVNYLEDGCKMEFHCDGDEDCKDMITLFDETERVEKTVTLINQILHCEKVQGVYTVVFEIPSLLVYYLKNYYYISDYKKKYGIKPHIVRKDGQPNRLTWQTSTSDVSIVTLTGNRVYVDALKCEIEEEVKKFIPYMFTEVCDIDESFFARVSGREFSNILELERLHKVKTSLGISLAYAYLFNDSSGSFNSDHRVQIMGGSSTLVIQAKEGLLRLLETIKESTETATICVPKDLRYDIRNQLDLSRHNEECWGVDYEFRDDDADDFITLDLHGCQPDLRNAVERINGMISEHIEKEKDKS